MMVVSSNRSRGEKTLLCGSQRKGRGVKTLKRKSPNTPKGASEDPRERKKPLNYGGRVKRSMS